MNPFHDLNTRCDLTTLDVAAVQRELHARDPGNFLSRLGVTHPHLFCAAPVIADAAHVAQMIQTITAIEHIVATPLYVQSMLQNQAGIARFDPHHPGVFYGYDFHLTDAGPRLIEINTNAGGAMLNVIAALAQRKNVPELAGLKMGPVAPEQLETTFLDMFRREWGAEKMHGPLKCIAIVDDAPAAQYLYPEFLLFQQLFHSHGIHAAIVDPRKLEFRDGALWHREQRVDLVYNRLTDFQLEAEHLRALREAYLARAVVVTPHPHGHALYADKRNLCLFSDETQLRRFGASTDAVQLLTVTVPRTVELRAADAETFWAERKRWFFKPAAGYGSKAAYRGDKLTRRVWEEISATPNYIAQEVHAPGERCVRVDGVDTRLKYDVRCYVYRGTVQWIAARLYQGQTTNFRTSGGGFAPVYAASFS